MTKAPPVGVREPAGALSRRDCLLCGGGALLVTAVSAGPAGAGLLRPAECARPGNSFRRVSWDK